MDQHTEEGRPAVNGTASTIVATTHPQFTAPTLAVVVRRQLANGGTRTTIYRTLAPAEKALERAAKSGLKAVVEFVRLEPVEAPTPAELAALESGEGR